jgi:hypothetical protein
LPAAQPNKIVGAYLAHCPHGASQPLQLGPQDGALIPDPSLRSGFNFRPATGKPDGTFEIDNVPEGTRYFLQIGGQLYDTDQRVIDATYETRVRCDPSPNLATEPVHVAFSLTHMTPFTLGDSITASSFALNNPVGFTNLPKPGDSALTAELDWFGALPDASLGDDFTVVHTHQDPSVNGRFSSHLVDSFTGHQVTLQAGNPATISGSFAPAPTGSIKVDLDASAYLTPYGAFDEFFNDLDIQIVASPDTTDLTQGAALGELQRPIGDPTKPIVSEQIAIGDPFPASWTRSATLTVQISHAYQTDGKETIGLPTGGAQTVTFTGSAPSFETMLLPPTGLLINGSDGGLAHLFPSDIPPPITVEWQPVKGATNYQVLIWHFSNDPRQGFPTATGVTTAATKVVLPGTQFVTDGFYALTVSAQDRLPDLAQGHLFANLDHQRTATIGSGRLRFSATCGDGVVDPGEECDTAGESATCNIDCTLAKCGDGVLNTTAGEQCDTINDTATCIAATCKTR